MNVIAERALTVVESATGTNRPIVVKLGQPFWIEEGEEAACTVAIDGLLDEPSAIRGIDLLDAVQCALRFIDSYLKGGPDWKVYWPDGESYSDSN